MAPSRPSNRRWTVAAVSPALDEIDQLLVETKRTPRGAAGQQAFLSKYAEIMIRQQAAMRLVNRDPAVSAHPGIGPRRQRIEREISARLSNRKGARARALSFAATGLWLYLTVVWAAALSLQL